MNWQNFFFSKGGTTGATGVPRAGSTLFLELEKTVVIQRNSKESLSPQAVLGSAIC